MNLPCRSIAILLALGLFSSPLWGYVVLLKDGTQLITRDKYRRDGDKVFLVLPNGTETFIDAAEVDFKKTEELNTFNIGQARLIEQQADTILVQEEAPYKQETLSTLARRSLSLPQTDREGSAEAAIPFTKAGFVDLWAFHRAVHPDLELAGELGRYLNSQAAVEYEIFEGTTEGRVLLDMVANSEVAVFKNLRDAASALVNAQARFPGKIEALELVMSTEKKRRAGQFVLTKELADELLSGSVDMPTFFYRHVQF